MVIERGVLEPLSVENGIIRVNIGSTVYTVNGLNITIICNVIVGKPLITISWYRNGELDDSRGNVSTITVTDALHDDVFTCKADNKIRFDQQNTTIKFANNAFCIDTS